MLSLPSFFLLPSSLLSYPPDPLDLPFFPEPPVGGIRECLSLIWVLIVSTMRLQLDLFDISTPVSLSPPSASLAACENRHYWPLPSITLSFKDIACNSKVRSFILYPPRINPSLANPELSEGDALFRHNVHLTTNRGSCKLETLRCETILNIS